MMIDPDPQQTKAFASHLFGFTQQTVHQSNQNNEYIVSTLTIVYYYYSFYGKYSFSGRQQHQPICHMRLEVKR